MIMRELLTSFVSSISIGDSGDLGVPSGAPTSDTVTVALKLVTGIAAGIALLVITVGALRLITSRGNPEGLNKARDTIIYAMIGFIISAAAFMIVTFVVEQV